ncbi:MAG: methyltransferase domain-containing protein [Bacteroidota bacterium]|nr:methyltransferase domain-containing protein [Bacteroidota bacterium]
MKQASRKLGRLLGWEKASTSSPPAVASLGEESGNYWTEHNVTLHKRFSSAAESLAYLNWRNAQYHNYIELMPVKGFDNKAILDFGCGPGHDLVGFGEFSRPAHLWGVDVSSTSLAEASGRLSVHGISAELLQLNPDMMRLPIPDESIDHIHSSGVLHHTPDPREILEELRRVLKKDGTMNVMVYNFDSIWVHLYVAYVKQILEGEYSNRSLREAFKHTTDGVDCPISNVYKSEEWIALCAAAGFKAEFRGAAISLWESSLLAKHRFDACMHERLPSESREFLLNLSFDEHGYALSGKHYAGIDGCYSLRRA